MVPCRGRCASPSRVAHVTRCVRDEAWTVTLCRLHARLRQSHTLHRHRDYCRGRCCSTPTVRSAPAGSGVVHLFPSAAPRSCIGRSFAMVETVVVLAAIVGGSISARTRPPRPVRSPGDPAAGGRHANDHRSAARDVRSVGDAGCVPTIRSGRCPGRDRRAVPPGGTGGVERAHEERLLRSIGLDDGLHVLEVGCGPDSSRSASCGHSPPSG